MCGCLRAWSAREAAVQVVEGEEKLRCHGAGFCIGEEASVVNELGEVSALGFLHDYV